MKACKNIFNISGIILAIFLSLFTFATLLTTPVVSTCTSLLQPQTIQQFLQNMNFSEQLENTLKESAPTDLQNLDVKFIDDLIASELMNDIMQLYIDNMIGLLEKNSVENISQQQIQTLLVKHTPTLTTMIHPYLPKDIPLSDSDINNYAYAMLEPALLTLVTELPTLEDFGIDNTTLTLIHMLYSGTLLKYCILAIGILSLLIFLCRFPRFKGLMWLGVIYLLSAMILFLVSENVKALFTYLLSTESYESFFLVIEPIIDLFKTELTTYGRTIIILGFVFSSIFIFGRLLFSVKTRTDNKQLAA